MFYKQHIHFLEKLTLIEMVQIKTNIQFWVVWVSHESVLGGTGLLSKTVISRSVSASYSVDERVVSLVLHFTWARFCKCVRDVMRVTSSLIDWDRTIVTWKKNNNSLVFFASTSSSPSTRTGQQKDQQRYQSGKVMFWRRFDVIMALSLVEKL